MAERARSLDDYRNALKAHPNLNLMAETHDVLDMIGEARAVSLMGIAGVGIGLLTELSVVRRLPKGTIKKVARSLEAVVTGLSIGVTLLGVDRERVGWQALNILSEESNRRVSMRNQGAESEVAK
jgi:hypothetical protein